MMTAATKPEPLTSEPRYANWRCQDCGATGRIEINEDAWRALTCADRDHEHTTEGRCHSMRIFPE